MSEPYSNHFGNKFKFEKNLKITSTINSGTHRFWDHLTWFNKKITKLF